MTCRRVNYGNYICNIPGCQSNYVIFPYFLLPAQELGYFNIIYNKIFVTILRQESGIKDSNVGNGSYCKVYISDVRSTLAENLYIYIE